MTKNGYRFIIERINNRGVNPPDGLTASELITWLNGYAKCQHDIIDIIKELGEGAKE